MTIGFMAYAILSSALLAGAAWLLDRHAGLRHRPRRWAWAAALIAAQVFAAATPWRPHAGVTEPMSVSAETEALADGRPARLSWLAAIDRFGTQATDALRVATPFDHAARSIWILTSVAVVLLYAVGVGTLARRRRRWHPAVVAGHAVLLSPDTGPAVVGLWRPRIVIPTWALALEATHLELLVRHEAQHLRAADQRLTHLAALVLCVMPWNVCAWWMASRLRLALEMDCDDRVLADEPPVVRDAYAHLLVDVATRPPTRLLALAPALLERPSPLRRRIAAMRALPVRYRSLRLALTSLFAVTSVAAALALPAPSMRSGQQAPYEVGTPGLENPVVLKMVKPAYTPEAMRQKIEGEVLLAAVVGTDGAPSDITVTTSLDTVYGLDASAIEAAKLWRFRPGRLKGKAVPVQVSLTMTFRLH